MTRVTKDYSRILEKSREAVHKNIVSPVPAIQYSVI